MHYIVGIDFGTHYTKIAYRKSNSDIVILYKHDNSSYKIASSIVIDSNGLWKIGHDEISDGNSGNVELYKYFKIEYAQNDEFELYNSVEQLTGQKFEKYSADILSVAYLHRVMATFKFQINNKLTSNNNKGGIFSRLRKKNLAPQNTFEWRLGVPTEYSSKNQEKRFVKFNMLLFAAKLALDNIYSTIEEFDSESFESYSAKLQNLIIEHEKLFKEELTNDIHSFFMSEESQEASVYCMKSQNLRVLPESAAAINVIVSAKSILPGIYSSVDIGGGTTDITFFNVHDNDRNQTFKFLGSVSVNFGVNDLLYALVKHTNCSYIEAKKILSIDYDSQSKEYKMIIKAFYEAIEGQLIYLYKEKIETIEESKNLQINGQFALMLGGGALLPSCDKNNRENTFLLFNAGNTYHSFHLHKILKMKALHEFSFSYESMPSFSYLKKETSTFMVAFGLTTEIKRVVDLWDFSFYKKFKMKLVKNEEIGIFPWQTQVTYVYKRITEGKNLKIDEINDKRKSRKGSIKDIIDERNRCLRIPFEGEIYPDPQVYFECLLKNKYKPKKSKY